MNPAVDVQESPWKDTATHAAASPRAASGVPSFLWELGAWLLLLVGYIASYGYDRGDAIGRGGRVFVVDRLALGLKPREAAWTERQHPHPTAREFSLELRRHYCVAPAFGFGSKLFYRLTPRGVACPAGSLPSNEEVAR